MSDRVWLMESAGDSVALDPKQSDPARFREALTSEHIRLASAAVKHDLFGVEPVELTGMANLLSQ